MEKNEKQIYTLFTLGKLKTMYYHIKECGDELMKTIDIELIKNGNDRNRSKGHHGKIFNHVISTRAFGLKLNSIKDNESPFRKHGKSLFAPSLKTLFRELCLLITLALLKVVRLNDFQTVVTAFFHSVLKVTLKYRTDIK